MAMLLGGMLIVSLGIAVLAGIASTIGALLWLCWRIALVPYFRMSKHMQTWYRREQQKDWCTRCGQRVVFGVCFTVVQVPFFFAVQQTDFPMRSITLVIGCVLLLRGVWGYWLGGRSRKLDRIAVTRDMAHDAFHDLAPATGARAREVLMDVVMAERIIRLGVYTLFVATFFGALAWDAGARDVISLDVLP